MTLRRLPLLCLASLGLLGLTAQPAGGQGVGIRASRQIATQDLDIVALSLARGGIGPLGVDFTASRANLSGAPRGTLWGSGIEFNALRSGASRPYLLVSGEIGFGTGDGPRLWTSVSGGLGWALLRGRLFGIAAEGRYRKVSDGYGAGLDIGVKLSVGPSKPSNPLPAVAGSAPVGGVDPVPLATVDMGRLDREAPNGTIANVVRTAIDAMGAPYQWGGTAADGFDCSGLIQYAYAQHGITVPRRSVDQAGVGAAVARDLSALVPGDILTFATSGGGQVSHVGLYVGDGRFIHSTGSGVQVSRLSADDPYGAWWVRRWIGARRVTG